MKTFRRRAALVSLVCAASVTFSGVSTAYAAAPQAPAVTSVSAEEVSEQQIAELAGYLEAIYGGELTAADGTFDRAAAEARFGEEFADTVEAQIAEHRASAAKSKASSAPRAAKGKDSYGKCLLKAVGLGGLGGATSAIMNKLSEKKWSDAARLITKEAAKRGIKIAVKGGVVGLAATLAASGIWCATPWA